MPRPTGEAVLVQPPHSALVGLMAEPLSRSVPVRRSTVLMLVAFLGFGTLTLLYPPAPKPITTITTNNPNGIIPGILGTTTTTTHPVATTTTTTAPPVATTTTTIGGTTSTVGRARFLHDDDRYGGHHHDDHVGLLHDHHREGIRADLDLDRDHGCRVGPPAGGGPVSR